MAKGRLWNRDFTLLWQGGAVSALGDQAYFIAILLWTKEATDSGSVVGAVMFAGAITSLLIPFGGVLADRFPRVRLLVLFDLLSGILVLGLAALFFVAPTNLGLLIPALLLTNFLRGSCSSLFHPVSQALVPDLVPDESLSRANAALQNAHRLMTLLGQAVGAVLFRVLGAPLLLLIDGISFLLSGLSELFIREPERAVAKKDVERVHPLRDVAVGFHFTGRIRGFRIYLLEASIVNFTMAALFVGLPFYVEDALQASTDWYGYLLAAMGLGALIGAWIASRCSKPGVRRGTAHLVCLVVLSSCHLPLSLVQDRWAALAIIIAAWVCVGFHQVLLTTLVQKRTPSELRGRVFGVLILIRHGLFPLGAAAFGILIDQIPGSVATLLFWSGVASLVVILWAVAQRDYRSFFTGDEEEVPADATN